MAPSDRQLVLRVFGTPALLADGCPVSVRSKDLALMAYLALNDVTSHARSALASLLWGNGSEREARHSLSQSLCRVRSVLGACVLLVSRQSVTWRGPLASDADLLRASTDSGNCVTTIYGGDFLAGLVLGPGACDFEHWAEHRRAHYRLKALRGLNGGAAAAERRGDWEEVLNLALRAVEIEPLFEEGHRGVIRAWTALGDRSLAVRHYHRLRESLRTEANADPDPLTSALAASLMAEEERLPRRSDKVKD